MQVQLYLDVPIDQTAGLKADDVCLCFIIMLLA